MTGFVRGDALPERAFAPFEAGRVAGYARLSGDDNPIHAELSVAAALGLAERPVHGLALMALLEPFLRGWRADLAIEALALRFVRPVLIGESFTLRGRVVAVRDGGAAAMLRLMVHDAQGRPACVGEAAVRRCEGIFERSGHRSA